MTDLSKQRIEAMEDLLKVQGASGNWDCDPYMHGMYNGMLLMYSMAADKKTDFKTSPQYWKKRSARWYQYLTSNTTVFHILRGLSSIVIFMYGITITIPSRYAPAVASE